MTTDPTDRVAGLVALLLLVVMELIRKRQLREQYALLWVGTAVVLLGSSSCRTWCLPWRLWLISTTSS